MNKRDRSVANMRSEAQKIYHQRQEIKRLEKEIDKYKDQQKEFIKCLEKRYKDVTSVIGSFGSNTDLLYGKKDMIEEILQKCREIIGDDK